MLYIEKSLAQSMLFFTFIYLKSSRTPKKNIERDMARLHKRPTIVDIQWHRPRIYSGRQIASTFTIIALDDTILLDGVRRG